MARNKSDFSHSEYVKSASFEFGKQEAERMADRLSEMPFCKPGTSPIETMFGCALVIELEKRIDPWANVEDTSISRVSHEEFDSLPLPPISGLFAFYQVKIGPYRADFVLAIRDLDNGTSWHIAELDGHDFHERTKEQAARDKQRDRYFQSLGLSVFRFTGSEVWRDPESAVCSFIDDSHAAHTARGQSKP